MTFPPCRYCVSGERHEPQVPLPPDHNENVARLAAYWTEVWKQKQERQEEGRRP